MLSLTTFVMTLLIWYDKLRQKQTVDMMNDCWKLNLLKKRIGSKKKCFFFFLENNGFRHRKSARYLEDVTLGTVVKYMYITIDCVWKEMSDVFKSIIVTKDITLWSCILNFRSRERSHDEERRDRDRGRAGPSTRDHDYVVIQTQPRSTRTKRPVPRRHTVGGSQIVGKHELDEVSCFPLLFCITAGGNVIVYYLSVLLT